MIRDLSRGTAVQILRLSQFEPGCSWCMCESVKKPISVFCVGCFYILLSFLPFFGADPGRLPAGAHILVFSVFVLVFCFFASSLLSSLFVRFALIFMSLVHVFALIFLSLVHVEGSKSIDFRAIPGNTLGTVVDSGPLPGDGPRTPCTSCRPTCGGCPVS